MRHRCEPPVRLLAVLLAAQTSLGVGAAAQLQADLPRTSPTAGRAGAAAAPPQADPLGELVPPLTRAAPAPPPAPPTTSPGAPAAVDEVARRTSVMAVLAGRAAAVLRRDRAAFLASVDPTQVAFLARQAALFDALAQVPLRSWTYSVDPTDAGPAGRLDRRYGSDTWTPAVTLRYALEAVDDRPTAELQGLTFVRRGDRWLLASDTDRPDRPTPRGLWDTGPVVVVRGERSLVLGHPGQEGLLRRTAAEADRAVETVTALHGPDWTGQVAVLVPATPAELDAVLAEGQDLSAIAAVATARLDGPAGATTPVGDRVVLNPAAFPRLGATGRRVVLTHEVAHVATRRITGPAAPAWLVEGYADHLGYSGAGVAVTSAARELAADVRAGRVPVGLPSDADFSGSNPDLAQAYEASWLACELIVAEHGEDGLRRFYRAVGRGTGFPEAVVRTAMRDVLATTPEDFTQRWQDDLRRRLGSGS